MPEAHGISPPLTALFLVFSFPQTLSMLFLEEQYAPDRTEIEPFITAPGKPSWERGDESGPLQLTLALPLDRVP